MSLPSLIADMQACLTRRLSAITDEEKDQAERDLKALFLQSDRRRRGEPRDWAKAAANERDDDE